MHFTRVPSRPTVVAVVAAAIVASGGCSSIIGSAYLREAWIDAVEHAAQEQPVGEPRKRVDSRADAEGDREAAAADLPPQADGAAADGRTPGSSPRSPATLDEAVAHAESRLERAGGLTPAARATLLATLEATPRRDWGVVVEEFTAVLAISGSGSDGPGRSTEPAVPPAIAGRVAGGNVGDIAETEDEEIAPEPPITPPEAAPPPRSAAPPAAAGNAMAFTIRNACFASRVRGWGVVDRFDTPRFAPGQEVIVYFELDGLESRESSAGHWTRVDTALRLVGDDGTVLDTWRFDPLEETCRSPRRDYFARYLVTLPSSLPEGACRVEIAVTDVVGDRTAEAALPLEVVP